MPSGSGRALRAWSWLQDLAVDHEVHVLVTCPPDDWPELPPDYPAFSLRSLAPGLIPIKPWLKRLGVACPFMAVISRRTVAEWALPLKHLTDLPEIADLARLSVQRVVVFRLYLHDVAAALSPLWPTATTELDLDDLESTTRRSVARAALRLAQWRAALRLYSASIQYELLERCLAGGYSRAYLAAPEDLAQAPVKLARAFACRPNMISIPEYSEVVPPTAPLRLLFIGTLDYLPNEEAVRFLMRLTPLLDQCLEQPWCLHIIGRGASASLKAAIHSHPSVEHIEHAQHLASWYRAAHIVLVPVFAGGGTKFKTIEAFSYRRPVVSTGHGVRGLGAVGGRDYLPAENLKEFACAIMSLANEPQRAELIGQAGLSRCEALSTPLASCAVARASDWVVHDYLQVNGGAERLVLSLAKGLPDFALGVSGIYPDFSDTGNLAGVAPRILGGQYLRQMARVPRALLTFFRQPSGLAQAERIIYSGIYAPLAARKHKALQVYYCHTPPRFAFDRKQEYLQCFPTLLRPLVSVAFSLYRWRYVQALRQMDMLISNSAHVQRRLHTLTGLASKVIHPPVDSHNLAFIGQQDYYLSVGRLEPGKRVDRIVQAFCGMPEKNLVVTSGGSQLESLRRIAANAPNIRFTGWLSDAELADLLGNCIAAIYVPRDEDFGMSAVEAMAAGKPVIGVAEGGLLETIVPLSTGILLGADPTPQQIAAAVIELTAPMAAAMRAACEQRAEQFSTSRFITEIQHAIQQAQA